MMNRQNFNRCLLIVFLPFVSFLITEGAKAQTSDEGKKDIFQSEDSPEAASTPAQNADSNIERLKGELNNDPENIYLILELAENYNGKGAYDKASALLWKHVDKLDREALLVLARTHEKGKEPGEMIRALNLVLAKKAKDLEALTLMGKAHLLQKKNKEAMESYKKVVEINPKYEPAYRGLIELYEKRNPPNLYELRILYQDMIDNIGPRYRYYVKLCEINTMDNTHEAAIKACKSAIAKNSKEAEPYVYLGLSLRATGEELKGIKTLRKAADEFPDSELAQYTYAKTLEEEKNYVEAMNLFKAGTEANGKSARSWLGLASTAFEIRKFEVSLIAFKNACKYDNKNAAAFRKATATLRNARNSEWVDKFATAAEHCTY